jgi:hypothetical protein
MIAIIFSLFSFFFYERFRIMLVDGRYMSVPYADLQDVCGSEDIAPRTLDLTPRQYDKPHKPATLPLDKSRWYPFNRTLDGFHKRSGFLGEEKNISYLSIIVQSRHYTN